MKTVVNFILALVLFDVIGICAIRYIMYESTRKSKTTECYVSQTIDLSKISKDIEKRYINRLENEDREWSEKYNIVLKRLNNVEANMDMLDVWTGDEITVNYKNGLVKHFIVNENTISEKP